MFYLMVSLSNVVTFLLHNIVFDNITFRKPVSIGDVSRQLQVVVTWIGSVNSDTFAAETSPNDHMDLTELSKDRACPFWHDYMKPP